MRLSFPQSLVRSRSLCGAWVGVLLAALLVVGSPARAAQPRLLAPASPTGLPEEHAEENASEALRETRAEPVRAERRPRDARRTPPLLVLSAHDRPARPDPSAGGLAARLRC